METTTTHRPAPPPASAESAAFAPGRAASSLWNFLGFQCVWFVAVVGAAWGYGFAGPLAAALFLGLHLVRHGDPRAELRLIGFSAVVGFAVDSTLGLTGVLRFDHGAPAGLCPPWLLAIWATFAATLRGPLAWLRGRTALAAALGAVAGPLAYAAGERLGAVTIGPDPAVGLIVLAMVWAAVTPLLVALAWRGATQSDNAREMGR